MKRLRGLLDQIVGWIKGEKQPSGPAPEYHQISRSDIIRGLEDLISFEEGFKFQSLAVILGKKRWPELIASEWKYDLGMDAYAPPIGGKPPMALAGSLTASIGKIKEDLARIRETHGDVEILVFSTPQKVTNHTKKKRQQELADSGDEVRLIIVSREDIVTSLLAPENAALCKSHLGLAVPIPPVVEDKLEGARSAVQETVAQWLAQPTQSGVPLVRLSLTTPSARPDDTPTVVDLEAIGEWLTVGRRVLLTAPGGSGKTTTMVQAAKLFSDKGDLCFLIDLPQWITSSLPLLDYLSQSQPFLSRSLSASDIARLCQAQHVNWLLNGWNEIAEEEKTRATYRLRELDRDFPGAGVLLATRSGRVSPPFPSVTRVDIHPLTADQRRAYLNQALGDRADALLESLGQSEALDSLTRVPLILAEVTELRRSGLSIPESTYGILEAMSARIEASEQHHVQLSGAPVHGLASQFLSGLAMVATHKGAVLLPDAEARRIVSEIAEEMVEDRQLVARPDPGSVAERLCAHHCLQRMENDQSSIRFQHQRFQEFYAARAIKGLLTEAPEDGSLRAFEADVLDRPSFGAAIEMLAEAVGLGSPNLGGPEDRTLIGTRLVTSALKVDPIFAASLSRLCGEAVWERVGAELGGRLRALFASEEQVSRRYALAGMLATGSPDFIDLIEPLLTADDGQVRLGAYRALGEFHPGTLGPDWSARVSRWQEPLRVELVREIGWLAGTVEIPETLLRVDESDRVRGAAVDALLLKAPPEMLERNREFVTDAVLDEALRFGASPRWFPPAWQGRVGGRIEASIEAESDSQRRIHLLLSLLASEEDRVVDRIKEELEGLPDEALREMTRHHLLGEVINLLQKKDRSWIDSWISERMISGVLPDGAWIDRVKAITPDLRARLVGRLTDGGDEEPGQRAVVSLLAKFADVPTAELVVRTLFSLVDENGEGEEPRPAAERDRLHRRLRDLALALRPDVLVSAILRTVSGPPTPAHLKVVLDILSVTGRADAELDRELPGELRGQLRDFLVGLQAQVLGLEDYTGTLKAGLATAISQVGTTADAPLLERLIEADIQRVRNGRAALHRGERGDAANGSRTVWSTWYCRAIIRLGEATAVPILLRLLGEPEFEVAAAKALVTEVLGITPVDQRFPGWGQREGEADPHAEPDPDLRIECTQAIASRLRHLLQQKTAGEDDGGLDHRLRELAALLAIADRGEATDSIFHAITPPGQWDMWQRTVALERMLDALGHLPAEATLDVVDSILERIEEIGFRDQQVEYLPVRLLSVLSFVDPPAPGFERICSFLEHHPLPNHRLSGLIRALGRSGSDLGLELLSELSERVAKGNRDGVEWVRAVAGVGTPQARQVLFSFVDPESDERPFAPSRDLSGVLEEEIAALAEADVEEAARLTALCESDLDPDRRTILAGVMARLGTNEALLQALLLIQDGGEPPVPYPLEQGLRDFLIEHRPTGSQMGIYTLVPRSGVEIRRRLFEFWLEDTGRREAAEGLLWAIDEWRLEYGKPMSEPRHPAFETGVLWPPVMESG